MHGLYVGTLRAQAEVCVCVLMRTGGAPLMIVLSWGSGKANLLSISGIFYFSTTQSPSRLLLSSVYIAPAFLPG